MQASPRVHIVALSALNDFNGRFIHYIVWPNKLRPKTL